MAEQAQSLKPYPRVASGRRFALRASCAPDFRLPERLLLVATVLLFSANSLSSSDPDSTSGSPLAQGLWALIYIIAFFVIVREKDAVGRLARSSMPLVLIVLLAFISTAWSEVPLRTAEKAIGLAGSGILSIFFVRRLGLKEFIDTLGFALTAVAVLSACLILFVPSIGLMEDGGEWKGCFSHKNGLGYIMVLAIVTIACSAAKSHGVRRLLQILALVLCLVLLIGSRSVSSIIVALLLALVAPILLSCRALASAKPAVLASIVLAMAVLVAGLFGFGLDQVFDAFGKDATLTGRTDLWSVLIGASLARPFFGYGYEAFFNPGTVTKSHVLLATWDAGMAHNGFLQVALDLGIVGLVLVIQALVAGFRRAAKLFWQGSDASSLFPLLVILYTFLINLTEAGLVADNDLRWIVFLTAFLYAGDMLVRTARPARVSSLADPVLG